MTITLLKEPIFIPSNWETQYKELVSAYEAITGTVLSRGQVESILLGIFAYRENILRIMVNDVAKQNLLAYAKGEVLDHLGALLGVSRLESRAAVTTIRFSFNNLDQQILIPAGTRVGSRDGKVMFATDKDVAVSAGSQYVDVSATCTDTGEIGNGYLIGQVSELVDPIAYVSAVENVSITYGGSDIESDEHFRQRIQLAPESFSTAGTVVGYRYWAMTAHQDIVDVAVWSEVPGEVRIAPLLKDGEIPDSDILELVEATLSHEKVRPLTDRVIVEAPEPVYYDVTVQLYIYSSHSMLSDAILSTANETINVYTNSIKEKLGHDIVPERIISVIQNIPGVYRAIVIEPSYIQVEKNQVAICNDISMTITGSVDV